MKHRLIGLGVVMLLIGSACGTSDVMIEYALRVRELDGRGR